MSRRRRPDPRKTFEADMQERVASGDREAVKRLEKIGRRQGYIDPPKERDDRHGGINDQIRRANAPRIDLLRRRGS
jgi:hypothetical protein